MKAFGLWIAVLCAAVVLGCGSIAARIGPEVATSINRYCDELSATERALLRDSINAQIAPNEVRVTCARDSASEEGASDDSGTAKPTHSASEREGRRSEPAGGVDDGAAERESREKEGGARGFLKAARELGRDSLVALAQLAERGGGGV